ncbi:MAG: hypothetical protein JXQ65_11720 [Candidatus Marinimicrobia bacterium]|nr:hypothetical protein [Candidatus Neomarinimicrobiota bacterium]
MNKATIIIPLILLVFLQNSSNTVRDISISEKEIMQIYLYRQNMNRLLDFLEQDTFLTNRLVSKQMISLKQKDRYRIIWGTFWHYLNRIDEIKNNYQNFYTLKTDEIDQQLFINYYFAQLTYHSYSLKLINVLEKYKEFDVILNEKYIKIPYPENSYTILKNKILNFRSPILLSMNYKTYLEILNKDVKMDGCIQSDYKYIFSSNYKNNINLTIRNTINNIDNNWSHTIYPTQKNFAKLLGNVKIWRKDEVFITDAQIEELENLLEPCDIILQRREWVLTNLFIPGYWTHSALYIGTPEKRTIFFNGDTLFENWLKFNNTDNFDTLLNITYPSSYKLINKQQNGQYTSVIESVEEGVIFNTLRNSATCDGIVILRPKLEKIEKAQAIYNAFSYAGQPYDYDFNFLTDSSLVCTELIYKSFESNEYSKGLSFTVKDIRNRKLLTANDIAMEFDNEYDTHQNQLDFIIFYDVSEQQRKAILSDMDNFRKSWRRSKFYFLYDKFFISLYKKFRS